jgi:hypothetical protein
LVYKVMYYPKPISVFGMPIFQESGMVQLIPKNLGLRGTFKVISQQPRIRVTRKRGNAYSVEMKVQEEGKIN